jgi:hypothetical protein
MRQHQSILEFQSGRYLRLSLGLCALAIGVYVWHEPPDVGLTPYGGTWLGYTLGTVGAVLILWLMLLGLRKRRYRSSMGSLQGWTSAHVYLGVSLLVIVSLHSALEFGWNVHTLAYLLMLLVIASGMFGVYAYLRFPELMTHNMGDETLETLLLKIVDLEHKCRAIALDLPDEVNLAVMKATRTKPRGRQIGGSLRRQLAGESVKCPTRDACDTLLRLGAKLTGEQAVLNGRLLTAMTRKSLLIDRIRRDLSLRARLRVWLFFHVPLSFALIAAVIAHVVSVFYYW